MSAPADKIWILIADVPNIGRFSPEVLGVGRTPAPAAQRP
jgi:hypothetical protein